MRDKSIFNIKIYSMLFILCFILMIASVPIIQLVKELRSGEPIQELNLFRQPPTVANLRGYEDQLEDNSIIASKIRPWYQFLSTRLAKQGNAKVVIGKDGWLFYRPALDYIILPGSNFYRDLGPLPAIAAFHKTLKEQNVELILVPVSGKATIYPENLSDRYHIDLGPPNNPHTSDFYKKLRENGIRIFDPTQILWESKDKQTVYIPQDTHWSPFGMDLVAKSLANLIKDEGLSDGTARGNYSLEPVTVKRFGDLYDMLELPIDRAGFQPLSITTKKVVDVKTGQPITVSADSPIVLLGDSFINVFSKSEMGWGEHAGFGEHLAYHLGTPLDAIAINDGGATTTRESLARRQNALMGKKLVIWQFPTRDLVNPKSEWKIVEIPKPEIDAEVEDQNLVVMGEIIKTSNVPDPNRVAYSDCLTYIKYRVISVERGNYEDTELLAVFWGMKNSKLMPPANFQIGEKHRLSLDLFEDHQELSHIMQADDTEDYEHIPFWVLKWSRL
jgi:alginate O-acetyltransferase complex protein AlgJ